MALAHYGIGLDDVRVALNAANANSPKGSLEDRITAGWFPIRINCFKRISTAP